MKAEAQAKEVDTHGGLLQFLNAEALPTAAAEMKLTNMLSGEEVRARTLTVRRSKGGRVLGVTVELLFPSETFWGLAFRLRKTTAGLLRLEQDIKSEKIDPRQRMVGLQGLSRKRLLQQVCDFRQYSGIAIR